MEGKKFLITEEGLSNLKSELDYLLSVRREEVAEKIKQAREMGNTENNAEYEDAKNDQAFVEGRILMLENIVRNATIIESPVLADTIEIGNKVLIQNIDGKIDQFTIVGSTEANPMEGKISNESPVGQAILGKKIGDEVEVHTPAGVLKLSIMDIS